MKSTLFSMSAMLVSAAVLISSCGGSSEKASDQNAGDEFDAAKSQIASDLENVLKVMPPPSEVPYLLEGAGADYNATLINPIENLNNYTGDQNTAALNLGVYATDIAYLTSYKKTDLALDYMGECQKLAAPVGVASAVDYGIVARFERNMENRDSLAMIINQVIEESGDRLSELDELNSAALLLTGSWIEGIYLSTTIVDTYPDDLPEEARTLVLKPLVKIVMDQKRSLYDLIKILAEVPSTESTASVSADIAKVKAIYDGELMEVERQIRENTGDFVLLPSVLDNLAAEVTRIRASIVN
ncbi:MAG: hypothetical protein AAF789_01815 [Bacteroidota bacterium]